jgi:putative transposase
LRAERRSSKVAGVARALRDRSPGFHHVTIGATASEPYFRDDLDRLAWIRRLVAVLEQRNWTCVIFCQLTTHVHLVIDVPDESLPAGMHRLNFEYARDFNDRYERRGVLQRARYWSTPKKTAEELLAAYRYVAQNPVEAGLVWDPIQWRWSSFATSCGVDNAFPFVDARSIIEELGGDPRTLLELAA